MAEVLIDRGIIEETGFGDSSGGRKPALLAIKPDAAYAVGIDFEATSIMAVVVDLAGNCVSSSRGKIETTDDKLVIVRKIIKTIHSAIKSSDIPPQKILGMGIGVPGLIDSSRGISVSYYSLPGWHDVHIRDLVRIEFNLPVHIEKNIRTMALAEKWFGQGKRTQNMICLAVRSGIGLGIVMNRKLFRGISESAGEIGHITVDKTGARCMCGNKGCLQTIASGRAIVDRMKKRMRNGEKSMVEDLVGGDRERITVRTVIAAARKGDKIATRIIVEAGEALGIATANIVNLFNPELIVIAGHLVPAGKLVLDPIINAVENRALEVPRKAVKIVFSNLGENIGAIGASALVICERPESWKETAHPSSQKELTGGYVHV